MKFIADNWQEIGAAITAIILALEAILNVVPTKKDYSVLLKIKAFIAFIFPNRAKGEQPDVKALFETISTVRTKRQEKKAAKQEAKKNDTPSN